MTPAQIMLVQTSYSSILRADTLAADFYRRLFVLDPSLRPLFPPDLHTQEHKFTLMLNLVVNGLDQLDRLLPSIESMGSRHAGYGTTHVHYELVKQALLSALEHRLAHRWTPELSAAWSTAYDLVATIMQAAAPTSA